MKSETNSDSVNLDKGASSAPCCIEGPELDSRYFTGPYADQIAVQLWAEIRDAYGCAHWWDRPLCPVYAPRPKRKSTRVAVKCGRCDGAGAIASFSIRYSGVCFACGGSGVRLISQAAYKRLTANRLAAQEQAA